MSGVPVPNPADWREGDVAVVETSGGTKVTGVLIGSGLGVSLWVSDISMKVRDVDGRPAHWESITVTRPAPPLPTEPLSVIYNVVRSNNTKTYPLAVRSDACWDLYSGSTNCYAKSVADAEIVSWTATPTPA